MLSPALKGRVSWAGALSAEGRGLPAERDSAGRPPQSEREAAQDRHSHRRVVQASLKSVLEPMFEADFLSCSYGFHPNRRAQDTVAEIHGLASAPKNFTWVLEADIAACFDEIDHTTLMERLRGRAKDKRTNSLVKALLKTGIMNQSGNR